MYKFKQLEWYPQEEQSGYWANPSGLQWNYSIVLCKNKQVEFAVLDQNYEYAPGFPEHCASVEIAKKKAYVHYESLLQHFIA